MGVQELKVLLRAVLSAQPVEKQEIAEESAVLEKVAMAQRVRSIKGALLQCGLNRLAGLGRRRSTTRPLGPPQKLKILASAAMSIR